MADPAGGARDRVARLRLIRSERIGPISFQQLLARFGSAGAALDALPELARRGGGASPRIASEREAAAEIALVERFGARHLFRGLAPYPPLLDQVEDAPPVLIVHGHQSLLDRPTVAIVGARNASAAAIRFSRQLAVDMADAGLTVVSGLARGIDGAAHQGALAGGTVAVVAGGIDVVFPPEHEALQAAIAEQGLIVAEQPPGTRPTARHFPRRNRIISGLSLGVVIVEAAPRSGSLITARLAADQGREVMAVPGSPLDPRAQGCNGLIRDGATLIQSADDVIETLRPFSRQTLFAPAPAFTPPAVSPDASDVDRRAVIALLGPTATPVDEVIRLSGLPPAIVQTVLLELELAGRLERHAGGRVSLAG
jgi:DNA processing protein